MMNIPWIVLKQYRIESVRLRRYMLDRIKIVMKLRYYGDVYEPISVTMEFGADKDHELYAYTCNFGSYHTIFRHRKELVKNLWSVAENLLKNIQKGSEDGSIFIRL